MSYHFQIQHAERVVIVSPTAAAEKSPAATSRRHGCVTSAPYVPLRAHVRADLHVRGHVRRAAALRL